MISYMLSKLARQTENTLELQASGDLAAALGGFELVFEALQYYEQIGYSREAGTIYRRVLSSQTQPEMVLLFHGLIQHYRRKYHDAREALERALLLSPENPPLQIYLARACAAAGDFQAAFSIYTRLIDNNIATTTARDGIFMLMAEQAMPGDDYYAWLKEFHDRLAPATYVEIGLGHGRSLALAGPGTTAVGIDPYQGFWRQLNYASPHREASLFPLASDDFFGQHDLATVLGQQSFDLAFIDGLHLFEQVLKDFINLERYARTDSVILIHDCLPVDPVVAERERCTGFWTGDVWRIIPCLKTFRPDLRIMTIPTKPSGLGFVTCLDPSSTVLADNYEAIIKYYLSLHCPETFNECCVICSVGSLSPDEIPVFRNAGSRYSLRLHDSHP